MADSAFKHITFQFLSGERRAVGGVWPPVRADVGHGVLAFGCRRRRQQRRAVVDERLPALVPEVEDVLGRVSLQVGEAARTHTDRKHAQTKLQTPKCLACLTCLQHLHRLLVWFEQFAGELAQDGEVRQVRRSGRVRGLAELLENKLDAVPKEINTKQSTGFTQESRSSF